MTTMIPNVQPILEEALRELNPDLRREYDEACQQAPELVAKESSKAKFLRAEDNHPWRAARRLALYWKFRKQSMTAEHWLKPMMGAGADGCCLGENDVTLLRRGYCYYSNRKDTGPLVVFDTCRRQGFCPEDSGAVSIFLSTVVNDVEVQTKGVTIVFVVTGNTTGQPLALPAPRFVATGMPVKIRRFVVVQNYEPHKEALVEYLAERRQLELQTFYKMSCDLIASSQSQQDLLQLVQQKAGIPWDVLPESCGGGRATNPACDPMFRHLFRPPSAILQLRLNSSRLQDNDDEISTLTMPSLWGSSLNTASKGTVVTTTNNRRKRDRQAHDPSLVSDPPHDDEPPAVVRTIDEMLMEVRQAMKRCRRSTTNPPTEIATAVSNHTSTTSRPTTVGAVDDGVWDPILPSDAAFVPPEQNLDFSFPINDSWE